MPYGCDPGTGTPAQRRDAVYLKVGDTDTANQLLKDAEVDFFLSQSDDGILQASALAAEAIAAKFARQPRVAHGPSSVDPSKIAADYLALAERIREEICLNAEVDAGGISKSDKLDTERDTDRVEPAFEIGQDDMFDNERRDRQDILY